MAKLFESSEGDVTRLILVRHGRTYKNAESRIGIIDDTPLDETGIKQANLVAKRLTDFPISALYSSPIARAMQTAEIIGNQIGKNPIPNENLIELNQGKVAGLTIPEVKERYPDTYKEMMTWIENQPDHVAKRPVFPGAENVENLENRARNFVGEILVSHRHECVCAVTHHAFIKGMIATLFGGSVHQPMNFIAFNTSITVVDFERDIPILMLFNDFHHLGIKLAYGKVTPF